MCIRDRARGVITGTKEAKSLCARAKYSASITDVSCEELESDGREWESEDEPAMSDIVPVVKACLVPTDRYDASYPQVTIYPQGTRNVTGLSTHMGSSASILKRMSRSTRPQSASQDSSDAGHTGGGGSSRRTRRTNGGRRRRSTSSSKNNRQGGDRKKGNHNPVSYTHLTLPTSDLV